MAALPTFISLHDAAKKLGVTEARLRSLITAGRMNAAEINGEIVVSADSLPQRKEDLPEYRKHMHLKGTGIGIAEAARKYSLNFSTVRRWTLNGVISRIGQDGQKVLLDEADVAYCADIYRKRGGGIQGKRIFPTKQLVS